MGAIATVADDRELHGKVRMFASIAPQAASRTYEFEIRILFVGAAACRTRIEFLLASKGRRLIQLAGRKGNRCKEHSKVYDELPDLHARREIGLYEDDLHANRHPAQRHVRGNAGAYPPLPVRGSGGSYGSHLMGRQGGQSAHRLRLDSELAASVEALRQVLEGRPAGRAAQARATSGLEAAAAAGDDDGIECVGEKSWAQRDAELRANAVDLELEVEDSSESVKRERLRRRDASGKAKNEHDKGQPQKPDEVIVLE